jgi:hypothetical protein
MRQLILYDFLGHYKHLLKLLRCAFSFLFHFLRYPSNLCDNTHPEIPRCTSSLLFYFFQCPSNLWDDTHLKILGYAFPFPFIFISIPEISGTTHLKILRCTCSVFIILLSIVRMEVGEWVEIEFCISYISPPTSPSAFAPKNIK